MVTMLRPESLASAGHFPTPPRISGAIAALLTADDPDLYCGDEADGWHRILDPCCSDGAALAQIADCIDEEYDVPVTTYGIELHADRAEAAASRLDEVLNADLFSTVVAAGAFSALYLNPPYDFDIEGGRAENAFLRQTTPALVVNGLLILIIPQNRLTSCQDFLANWYQDLDCWSFPDPEYDRFKQVILFGRRKAEPFPDPDAAAQITEWQEQRPPPLPLPGDLLRSPGLNLPSYDLPPGAAGEVLFTDNVNRLPRGIAEAAAGQGAWKRPEVQLLLSSPRELRVTPLMPARRGQMALMAAAGLLNNLTLEDNDTRVIIKGRTTKQHVLAEDSKFSQKWQDRLTTTLTVLDLENGEITEVA